MEPVEDKVPKIFLLMAKELGKADSMTTTQLFTNYYLNFFWPDDVKYSNILLFLFEAEIIQLMCLAYSFHRITEICSLFLDINTVN